MGYSFKSKGITITNVFQKILDESKCKPNKVRVDKGIEFYNGSIQSFFQNNEIEMYSTHNERKICCCRKIH